MATTNSEGARRLAYYAPDLQQWHDPTAKGSHRWRLTKRGLEVSEGGILRTGGAPVTALRILAAYRERIEISARANSVPEELLVATICTESVGNPTAVLRESGYVSDERTPMRVSAGLCQTLLAVAAEVMHQPVTRAWLLVPGNSIEAGARCIARAKARTHFDPPLVAGAYNAGSLRPSTRNPWGLVCTDDGDHDPTDGGDHVTKWIKWFNDAWAVLTE